MEKQVTRFPHVAVKIFDFLDIRSLAKSREVCKLWKIFIQRSKFFWVKFINEFLKHSKQSEEIQRQWKRVLFMANIKQIIGIAVQVQSSFCSSLRGLLVPEDYSPLPVLARLKDSVNLYKDLCKKIPNDKINPTTKYFNINETCLHAAAYYNNVDLFGFIIEKVEEKNPSVNIFKPQQKGYDQTPLHLAAAEGNLEICKIIIANVGDLSCLDEKYWGKTPFEAARERNRSNICFYFDEVRNKSSLDEIGWIFHKDVGIYFQKKSESTAVFTKAVATTAVTTKATETTSFWSKFWK